MDLNNAWFLSEMDGNIFRHWLTREQIIIKSYSTSPVDGRIVYVHGLDDARHTHTILVTKKGKLPGWKRITN